jgi:imidazoleglycerol-phosphate dehydratase
MQRKAEIKRKTGETDIFVSINLDGSGRVTVDTGYKFFDHMLTLLGWFSFFDLEIRVTGDIANQPDDHHIVEDVGITLGMAFRKALGEMGWGDVKGVARYGNFAAPIDECLVFCAVDIYTRGIAVIDIPWTREKVGDTSCEVLKHFFEAFSQTAKIVIHLKTMATGNEHHLFESAFKSLGKALEQGTRIDPRLLKKVPGS